MDISSDTGLNSVVFQESARTKRVMIVDDSEDVRVSLREFLELQGWVVDEAPNVPQAIHKLKLSTIHPDIILLDYLMPLENGISFWNILNDDRDLCHIPTIMITAHDMNSINAIGIRAVVKKPIDTEQLLILMNTLRNERVLGLDSHTILN